MSELVATASSLKPRIPAPRKQPRHEWVAETPANPVLRTLVRSCWAVAFGWKEETQGNFEENFFRSGNIVTAAILGKLFRDNSFQVSVEDILDRPTINAQAALLGDLIKYP